MSLEKILGQYRDTELYLLRLIAEAVAKGKPDGAEFYRQRLTLLQKLMGQAEKAVDAMHAGVAQSIVDELVAGYGQGMVQAASGATVPQLIDTTAVGLLATETSTALISQRPMILRSVQDIYTTVTETVTQRALVSGTPYDNILQSSLNEYADRGIKGFVDKAGRQWGMDSYAEMAVRTAKTRAQNQGRQNQYQDMGVNLILTSWHRAPADVCAPYQGKILSLDGVAGPRLVQDRTTGNFITVDVVATLQEAEAAGYHHVNCRHTDTAYIPGMPTPDVPDIAPGEYVALQRQRQIERNIRTYKKREAVALDPREKRKATMKVRQWQKAQREHIKRNNEFLIRRPEREKIREAGA